MIAILIVFIGLYRTEHSELAIIGFILIFYLGMTIINNNLQYKTGTNETYNYEYYNFTNPATGLNETDLNLNNKFITDYYSTFDEVGFFNSHNLGYWLVTFSILGFLSIFISLRRKK